MSGPAFASAEKHVLSLRAMVAGLRNDMKNIAMPSIDSGDMERSLVSLKSKMQALHIADIADVNINPGLIMTQLNMLKRLIGQTGINDLLDINVSSASMTRAMARISSLSADVPVNFDISGLSAMKSAMAGKVGGLTVPVKYEVKGGLDLKTMGDTVPVNFKPDLTALNSALKTVSNTEETIPVKFEIGAMPELPKFGSVESIKSGSLGIDAATLASWSALKNETYKLQAGLGDLRPLITAIGGAWATAGARAQMFGDAIGRRVNTGLVATSILMDRARTSVTGLGTWLKYVGSIAAVASSRNGGILGFGAATNMAAGAVGGLGGRIGGMGVGLRGWNATMAVTIPIIGSVVRSVGLWHLVLDGVIEAVIAVTSALLAAAPAVSVFVNVGKDLATNLQSQHAMFESLGATLGPLTGKFDTLASAMAPQVIEAYGGALFVVQKNVGLFNNVTKQGTGLFDTWVAKIDIWMATQGGFNKILGDGIGFLSQFGTVVGSIFQGLGRLMTAMPGTAHYLLDLVVGFARVFDWVTKLPAPLLTAGLAIHSIVVWGPPLLVMFQKLILATAKFGLSLAALAVNPMAWAVVAGAAVAYMVIEMNKATPAAAAFIGALDQQVATDKASTAIMDIANSIGQLNGEISSTNIGTYLGQYNKELGSFGNHTQATSFALKTIGSNFLNFAKDIPESLRSWHDLAKAGTALGHAVASIFTPGKDAAAAAAKQDISAYRGEIVKLTSQQKNLFIETGTLIGQGHSLSQSWALMDLAGVQAGDAIAVMKQKVDNLITGYENIVGKGGALNNSLQAINFAALQQQSQVANLTGGWDAFLKTLTGGESAFSTFGNQVEGMYLAAAQGGAHLTDANGKVSNSFGKLAAAGKTTKGSFTGLDTTSLGLRQSFVTSITDANAYADNLTLLASASGGGASKVRLLNQAVKDMVIQMVPAASHSAVLTTLLYGLAQRGGYKGADSLKQLAKWAGNTKDPMTQLDKITTILTGDAGNLITDVKNLSLALGQTLNNAMAAAIFQANHGQKAFDDFATAVLNAHGNAKKMQGAADTLAAELFNTLGKNVNATKNMFLSFAEYGLHLSQQKAQSLWDNFAQHGLPGLQGLGNKADSIRRNNLGPLQGSLARTTGGVQGLQSMINKLHGKTVDVGVHAKASGAISIVGSGWAAGQGNIRFHAAQGGIVPADMGVQGQDSVLVMTKPGEIFVPPEKGPILAPYLKRAGIPGFASGGQVNQFGNIERTIGSLSSFASGQEATDSDRAIKTGVMEAIKAAKATVEKAAAAALGGSGTGSDIVSYAQSFLGKIPYVWGGTSLSSKGADCSGFTGSVYRHFGYNPPRTSEAQGAWVSGVGAPPQPGGLAFYHSPPGGADPGHVAIIKNASTVISQGGGMGPKLMGMHAMPLLFTGTPPGGFHSSGHLASGAPGAAQSWMRGHMGDYGWGPGQFPSLLSLWNGESGWRWNANNPSSGAYGIPQALPGSKMATVGSDWRTNPITQMRWGAEYIRGIYGNPGNAYSRWLGRSPHWYGQGGVVPGFAAGGVATQGSAYLKAWQTRHGGGFGAAWGPVVVNEQIAEMKAKASRDSTLSHAGGLTNSQRSHWAMMAADDKRRLTTLNKELGTERSWRTQLGSSDNQLSSWIHAAGNNPSLSRNVIGWKAQLGRQKATIGNISKMLGWSNAHLKAFPPKPGQPGGGPPLPGITHTYGGDVANSTGAFLQSVLNPFTGVSMDQGGWLKPGWNPPMYNGTGQPERVGGDGCVKVQLVIDSSGSSGFEQLIHQMISKHVKIRGGGNVQRAYGAAGTVSGSSSWRVQ